MSEGALDPMQLVELVRRDPSAGREAVQAALMARAGSDPRLSALMGLMAQSQPPGEPAAPRTGGRADRIRRCVLEMREELAELRRRNDDLSDALGACGSCWGRSPDCDECRGRGEPGWKRPEPRLFDELVAPAVARGGRVETRRAPPGPTGTKGDE
jgi:hypothetical protein